MYVTSLCLCAMVGLHPYVRDYSVCLCAMVGLHPYVRD